MRCALALVALLLIAGCDKPSDEEKAAQAERDVALVQKANDTPPPLEPVVPEPIGAPDIERYDIKGAACNYAPGTSFGTLVVAREADAFMKIGGEVQRFAADAGARELPQHSRSLYNGREYSLRLSLQDPRSENAREGDLEGTVTLYDPHGRVAYEGTGLARCNS